MPDTKISALPAATTPLAGTELVPIVQSGATNRVTVANLTAGRSVAASALAVDDNSATDAVRITQTGAGNALVVEDSTNPDATPFVVNASGVVIVGYTVASANIQDSTGTNRTPQLQLQGNSVATAASTIVNWSSAAASSPGLYFAKSKSGTRGTQGVVASGDTLGLLQFNGDDGTNFVPAAAISSFVDGTPGLNDMPGRLVFSTTADGAALATERMRITNAGNVGVGTSSPVNRLQVSGSFGRGSPVTKTGNFTLATTENWLICNGAGSITVTFPAASSWTGREVMIKTIAAQTVVSASSNIVPLVGGAAGTAILAAVAGRWATIVSDGTNWVIMAAN